MDTFSFNIIIFLFGCFSIGTAIRIVIDTNQAAGRTDNVLTIDCIPEQTPNMTRKILMMGIKKEGQKSIATIEQNSVIRYDKDIKNNIKVKGYLAHGKNRNYLQISMTNPSWNDTGRYFCDLFYTGEFREFKKDRISANITWQDLDSKEREEYLMERVSLLENGEVDQNEQISQLENKITKLETEINDKDIAMQNQIRKLEQKINEIVLNKIQDLALKLEKQTNYTDRKIQDQTKLIEKQANNANKMIQVQERIQKEMNNLETEVEKADNNIHIHLEDQAKLTKAHQGSLAALEKQVQGWRKQIMEQVSKEPPRCAFSVGYDSPDIFLVPKVGDVMPFQQVLYDVGVDFDTKSMMFIAPKNGIYVFHLVIALYEGVFLYVDIVANDKVVAKLFAQDKGQSSVSSVVPLAKGQKVKAVVHGVSNVPHRMRFMIESPYTLFSGYLLQAI